VSGFHVLEKEVSMTPATVIERPTEQTTGKSAIRPFRFEAPEAELIELRRRITATPFPEKETVADFSQGVQLAFMQALARYWATDYDWRRCEARLNSHPQFITEIDGLDTFARGHRSTAERPSSSVCTHPSSHSSTTSTTFVARCSR
jgi:hypothetical protein